MAFYWVNLGTSYKEVLEYNFLWAPAYTLNKSGKKLINSGWKNVPKVQLGDVVFCHENGKIIYIAIATADAYQSKRPQSRAYNEWKDEGFKIEVDLEVLDIPLSTEEFKEEFIMHFNDRCVPVVYTVKKQAAQSYMMLLPSGAGSLILDNLGEISIRVQDKIHAVTSDVTDKITEREALIKSRIGQGKFRKEVLELWGETCPITKVNMPEMLIASHILPWQLASNSQKLDKFNGFPLSPAVDKLFDKGFISFSNGGNIIVHPSVSNELISQLGINLSSKILELKPQNIKYLEMHRIIYEFNQ